MIDRQGYIDAWGIDNVFEYPRTEWMSEYSAPPEVYPDEDLRAIDGAAFKDPASWWTVVLAQLGATV